MADGDGDEFRRLLEEAKLIEFADALEREGLSLEVLQMASPVELDAVMSAVGMRSGHRIAFRKVVGSLGVKKEVDESIWHHRSLPEAEMLEMQMLGASRISDFELVRVLGSGANGAVMEVKCTRSGHPYPHKSYALKAVFNFGLESHEVHHFQHEFDVLSQLAPHRRITRFYRQFADRSPDWVVEVMPEAAREVAVRHVDGVEYRAMVQFLVVEYFPKTLESEVQEREVEVGEVLHWVEGLLEAVAFLEAQRCAHLDLKLDNVLLTTDGREIALCDFGTAKRFADSSLRVKYSSGMSPGGNPAHLAPEILTSFRRGGRGEADVVVDYQKADVWAVGVLVHEIVANASAGGALHPIRDYPIAYSTSDGIVTYPLTAIPTLPTTYSAAFSSLITSLLHPDPHSRPSAASALSTLHTLLHPRPSPSLSSSSLLSLHIVSIATGKAADIEVDPKALIGDVADLAAERLGIDLATPSSLYTLMHAGSPLDAKVPLSTLLSILSTTSTLFLTPTLPSGRRHPSPPDEEHCDGAAGGGGGGGGSVDEEGGDVGDRDDEEEEVEEEEEEEEEGGDQSGSGGRRRRRRIWGRWGGGRRRERVGRDGEKRRSWFRVKRRDDEKEGGSGDGRRRRRRDGRKKDEGDEGEESVRRSRSGKDGRRRRRWGRDEKTTSESGSGRWY